MVDFLRRILIVFIMALCIGALFVSGMMMAKAERHQTVENKEAAADWLLLFLFFID
ncbi:hypothetical protein [Priestia koreensis]|uniref:hypothetical protein n=1 Tax=Priestia koreensis TaxID=284581 RepID=UPI001F5AA292|nr:hypothetical protein [Priestia koreensis]UNL84051.1 hypothetical protein IE339_18095 [Priestia koreensis]